MKLIQSLFATLVPLLLAHPAIASDPYPAKPMELVVAYAPGGGSDATARAIAEAVKPLFTQPIMVTNKPGASGSIGWAYVAGGPKDGSRLVLMNPEMMAVPLMGIGKTTIHDFEPIARFTDDPSSVTVRADAPWKTIEEFLTYAKANPGKVTISNAGIGTIPHVAAAALGDRTGTSYIHVPYQGSAPAILGLLSGDVQATTVAFAELRQHVESGKLRTLAVMADKRVAGVEAPTLKEKGYPLEFSVWRGIGMPKGAPKEAIAAWSAAARKLAADPAFQATIAKQSLTLAIADTPEFTAAIARQNEAFTTLVPKLGIKP